MKIFNWSKINYVICQDLCKFSYFITGQTSKFPPIFNDILFILPTSPEVVIFGQIGVHKISDPATNVRYGFITFTSSTELNNLYADVGSVALAPYTLTSTPAMASEEQ